tara:strand:- start:23 stop:373 length:351 start_codon:yes stop_codon:yes gene_type:complete
MPHVSGMRLPCVAPLLMRALTFNAADCMQFVFTVAYIGWASDPHWNYLWGTGTAFYVMGFILFGVGAANKALKSGKPPPQLLPWHGANTYGTHEDFHLLIALGDVSYFINAVLHTS